MYTYYEIKEYRVTWLDIGISQRFEKVFHDEEKALEFYKSLVSIDSFFNIGMQKIETLADYDEEE